MTHKKALFVAGQWSRAGGLEIVTQDAVKAFRKAGYSVVVLVAGGSGEDIVEESLKVFHLEPQNRILRSIWHRWMKYVVLGRKMDKFLSDGDRIVFGHTFLLKTLDYSRKAAKCVKWVWTHGGDIWGEKANKVIPYVNRLERMISVSRYTADRGIELGVKIPVSVVPNSIDTHRFVPTSTPEKIRHDEILICSRIPADFLYKGHGVLLKALPLVEQRLKKPVSLRIVGSGAGLNSLRELVAREGLEKRVTVTGFVSDEDLLEAYQHCGVFCMPSVGEGFGLVYAEAEACARPVVVSTFGGAPETVIDGKTGFLAAPEDVEANVKALVEILADPDKADEMGRNGRDLAVKSFSPEVFERNVLDVLNKESA